MRLPLTISDLSQRRVGLGACLVDLPEHEARNGHDRHISHQHAVVANYVGLSHDRIRKIVTRCLLVTEEEEVLNGRKTGPGHYDVAHLIPDQ